SFAEDTVSRYYSAMSGQRPPPPPGPPSPPDPPVAPGLSAELSALRELVRAFPSALLGYSGGVDSALLAVVLRQELGRDRMVAAIGRSASYPGAQWRTAGGSPPPARRGRHDEGGDPRGLAGVGASDVGRAGGALSCEPRGVRARDHAASTRAGGARRGLSARAGDRGGRAGPPSRRPRA